MRGPMRRSELGRRERVGGLTLLNYSQANFTRASEAAAVDPRAGWTFYDVVTPWKGTNVPRILPDGAVLLEGARENVVLRNREFDNTGVWGTFGTVTTGQSAPDGSTEADRLAMLSTDPGRFQSIAAANYVASGYVRQGPGSGAYVLYCYASAASGKEVFGTAGASFSRVQTAQHTAAVTVNVNDGRGSGTFTFSARASAAADAVWDLLQAEVGAFISSPIRTTTAAVTRALDLLSFATIPAEIQSGRWRISLYMLHDHTVPFTLCAQGSAVTEEVMFNNVTGKFAVVDGGANRVESNVVTWAIGSTLTLTFDAAAGSIEVAGALTGNGKVVGSSWVWPNTTTHFGSRANGTNHAFAVYGRPRPA